ncbi:MAG: hypothetical protein ABH807_02320 [Candidatus Shapirobacteria bacterium]
MIQSLIITGASSEERLTRACDKLQPPHPDFLEIIGEKSIGIEQIKEVRRFLILKPYSAKTKIILIREAEKLTLSAQNALLKTLEEPPPNSQIILETARPEVLLPTVLSRCQITKVESRKSIVESRKIKIPNRVGERLKTAGEYGKNKQIAQKFLENLIFGEREKLLKNDLAAAKNLSLCLESLNYLAANCNPVLVLGNLLLKYQY